MKVGDKYIIEIEEVIRRNGAPQIARIKGFNALVFDKYGLEKLEPYDGEKAYLKGYEDGKNAIMNESEKITTKDISDAYNKGLADVWKLVKHIESVPERGGLTNEQIAEVFGQYWSSYTLYNEFTAEEALDLYRRWEKRKQNEIKVGDEVYSDAFEEKGIVTHITADKVSCVCIICNGSTMMKVGLHGLHKTGRHFDAIAEVLAELRGE